jgi:5-methylcytosine-specific restriction enzyme B
MPPIELLLDFKKALILYGPPGTSKTYDANAIAQRLISLSYIREKESIKDYFKNRKDIFEKRIEILQMHANNTYDDFVAGIKLDNGVSSTTKGTIFSIIEKANNDDKHPFVLILDEINRTDISRVFGEVFSAMEYRGTSYKTSIGNYDLILPKNLYFIGTMNEIDFSLEHIDFAFRRRFIWQFHGFNKNTLSEMINNNLNNEKEIDIDSFVDRCESLNFVIQKEPSLGNSYEIGHTFFAVITDIYQQIKKYFSKDQWERSSKILWDISIKPTLEAYCGSLSKDYTDQFISKCKKVYFK